MLALLNKTKVLAGLDIGTSSIKIVELSQVSNNFRLDSYVIAPLPEDAIVEKEIKNVELVTSSIAQALERAKLSAKSMALAMPSSLVITKIIQMDGTLNDNDLESQIQLDANRYIPYPLEEVSLDFNILGPNEKDENKNDVLIAASRTEHVEARVDAVQDAGITIDVVDVESYAIERALPLLLAELPDEGAEQVVAVMNIGSSVSSLSVFENAQLIYTREEDFGGRQLTDDIRNRFNLDYEQAEYAKRAGGLPPEYENDVLQPFHDSVATQAFNALQFYYSSVADANIDHLFLAGGVAAGKDLAEVVQARTSINTSIANPFKNMTKARRISEDNLAIDAPALLTCCGLAMRSFI